MLFRVGVNLGDVIGQDDGTIYGDGVNIAARLEGLAEPGGLMISANAFEQIDGYMELKWEEVYAFEHTPHPIEFDMYYSS